MPTAGQASSDRPMRRSRPQSPNRLRAMRPAVDISIRFGRRWRRLSFAVAGLILTWLVLSQSFTAFLSNTAPQAALWFDPDYPAALVNLAEQALTTGGATRTITPTRE